MDVDPYPMQQKWTRLNLLFLVLFSTTAGFAQIPFTGAELYDHGMQHIKDGRLDDALSDFTKAIALLPKSAEVHNSRGSEGSCMQSWGATIWR